MYVFVVESSWWKCTTVSIGSPGNNKSLAEAPSPPSPSQPHPSHLGSVGSSEVHRVCSTASVHLSWSFDDPATHVYLLIIVLSPLFSS